MPLAQTLYRPYILQAGCARTQRVPTTCLGPRISISTSEDDALDDLRTGEAPSHRPKAAEVAEGPAPQNKDSTQEYVPPEDLKRRVGPA